MKIWILLFCLLGLNQMAVAQKNFSEGRIVYSVYMNNNNTEQKGTLTITLKGNKLKRVFKLNGGITNTLIMDLDKQETKSYSTLGNGKYATVKTKADNEKENAKFADATYKESNETKQIANYNCTKTEITYKDKSSNTVYYTTDLVSVPALIAMFPELKGFPLEYRIAAGSNNQIVVVATKIEVITIDNSEFAPLTGYQVITGQ
jgi:hypothetical protein